MAVAITGGAALAAATTQPSPRRVKPGPASPGAMTADACGHAAEPEARVPTAAARA
ncbi:hypothetical protein [Actinoplanes sp. CA-252034]|uniref:hypothetical protein n=1 Tax=Actinoplanes sp. CA-252034 TaxID=3239906 RepID=UPI003D95B24A